MPFCSKFMAALRRIMGQIGPKLGEIVEQITKYTKLVKDILGSPTVEMLIKLIPQGSEVKKWLEIALATVSGLAVTTENFYEKLKEWLDSMPTEAAKDRLLLAWASEAAKVADTEDGSPPKKTRVYDVAILSRVVADKPIEDIPLEESE